MKARVTFYKLVPYKPLIVRSKIGSGQGRCFDAEGRPADYVSAWGGA